MWGGWTDEGEGEDGGPTREARGDEAAALLVEGGDLEAEGVGDVVEAQEVLDAVELGLVVLRDVVHT